jgi:hypothetical protein
VTFVLLLMATALAASLVGALLYWLTIWTIHVLDRRAHYWYVRYIVVGRRVPPQEPPPRLTRLGDGMKVPPVVFKFQPDEPTTECTAPRSAAPRSAAPPHVVGETSDPTGKTITYSDGGALFIPAGLLDSPVKLTEVEWPDPDAPYDWLSEEGS